MSYRPSVDGAKSWLDLSPAPRFKRRIVLTVAAALNGAGRGLRFANHQYMVERSLIVQEYFKLMVLLNRANANANQITDIHFKIERKSLEQMALLVSTDRTFRKGLLVLCQWRAGIDWRDSSFSGLSSLEKYCANQLNLAFKLESLNATNVTTDFLNALSLNIQNQLKALALSQKFSES